MEIKKQSFTKFLFKGERGFFLCAMLAFIAILSGFWIYDRLNPGYTFKTEGVGYVCFITGIALIIIGTVAQAWFSDYPEYLEETGENGK